MIAVVSSKDNQYLKLTRSLARKKSREQAGLFIIEGVRNSLEALKSPCVIDFILVDAAKAENPDIVDFVVQAGSKTKKIFYVESRLFASTVQTEESQGVLLVAKMNIITLEDFAKEVSDKNLAILDGVKDPGNVGTILRTAWAANIGGVVMVNNSADVYNPKVVRSAMGALFNLPVITLDNHIAVEMLKTLNSQIAVADAKGEDFRTLKFSEKQSVSWLLGNEANGPSQFWREQATKTVAIPMNPEVESLNVAIAAGILFFSSAK